MIESPIAIGARPFGFTRLLGFPLTRPPQLAAAGAGAATATSAASATATMLARRGVAPGPVIARQVRRSRANFALR